MNVELEFEEHKRNAFFLFYTTKKEFLGIIILEILAEPQMTEFLYCFRNGSIEHYWIIILKDAHFSRRTIFILYYKYKTMNLIWIILPKDGMHNLAES